MRRSHQSQVCCDDVDLQRVAAVGNVTLTADQLDAGQNDQAIRTIADAWLTFPMGVGANMNSPMNLAERGMRIDANEQASKHNSLSTGNFDPGSKFNQIMRIAMNRTAPECRFFSEQKRWELPRNITSFSGHTQSHHRCQSVGCFRQPKSPGSNCREREIREFLNQMNNAENMTRLVNTNSPTLAN
jgi:hypothetical protein